MNHSLLFLLLVVDCLVLDARQGRYDPGPSPMDRARAHQVAAAMTLVSYIGRDVTCSVWPAAQTFLDQDTGHHQCRTPISCGFWDWWGRKNGTKSFCPRGHDHKERIRNPAPGHTHKPPPEPGASPRPPAPARHATVCLCDTCTRNFKDARLLNDVFAEHATAYPGMRFLALSNLPSEATTRLRAVLSRAQRTGATEHSDALFGLLLETVASIPRPPDLNNKRHASG